MKHISVFILLVFCSLWAYGQDPRLIKDSLIEFRFTKCISQKTDSGKYYLLTLEVQNHYQDNTDLLLTLEMWTSKKFTKKKKRYFWLNYYPELLINRNILIFSKHKQDIHYYNIEVIDHHYAFMNVDIDSASLKRIRPGEHFEIQMRIPQTYMRPHYKYFQIIADICYDNVNQAVLWEEEKYIYNSDSIFVPLSLKESGYVLNKDGVVPLGTGPYYKEFTEAFKRVKSGVLALPKAK